MYQSLYSWRPVLLQQCSREEIEVGKAHLLEHGGLPLGAGPFIL